jgi:hypothetical protein
MFDLDRFVSNPKFLKSIWRKMLTASPMPRVLLIPLPEACKVKKPVKDLIMEARPALCIFG